MPKPFSARSPVEAEAFSHGLAGISAGGTAEELHSRKSILNLYRAVEERVVILKVFIEKTAVSI